MVEFRLMVVADGTATDVNGDVAVVFAILHLAIVRIGLSIGKGRTVNLDTRRSHTAATVDGTEDGAILDVDIDVATHSSSSKRFTGKATTATEDVAVKVGMAQSTDEGVRAIDGDLHIALNVAFLAAAENGAEDGAAGDVHLGFTHIVPCVGPNTTVAHACTEEVAGNGVLCSLDRVAWHTQGTR